MPVDARLPVRMLRGEPNEMRALQQVLEDAPRYAWMTTGALSGPADAQGLCTMLPDGKTHHDKFGLGIHLDDAMVGCVDLIRGYPDATREVHLRGNRVTTAKSQTARRSIPASGARPRTARSAP